jgi:hypothetical protein
VLYIHLPRGQPYEANFFQVPVTIRSGTPLGDGIVMQADVCGKLDCSGAMLYKISAWSRFPARRRGTHIK